MGNLKKNLTFLGFQSSGIPPRTHHLRSGYLDVQLQGEEQLVLSKNINNNPQKACFLLSVPNYQKPGLEP